MVDDVDNENEKFVYNSTRVCVEWLKRVRGSSKKSRTQLGSAGGAWISVNMALRKGLI
jgi:hypothetical protein